MDGMHCCALRPGEGHALGRCNDPSALTIHRTRCAHDCKATRALGPWLLSSGAQGGIKKYRPLNALKSCERTVAPSAVTTPRPSLFSKPIVARNRPMPIAMARLSVRGSSLIRNWRAPVTDSRMKIQPCMLQAQSQARISLSLFTGDTADAWAPMHAMDPGCFCTGQCQRLIAGASCCLRALAGSICRLGTVACSSAA